jgi:capsular exopolysaccharide synthesis family protein
MILDGVDRFEDDRPASPADAWQTVIKGRMLILYSVLIGLAGAFLICLLTERQYRAVVVLNVERDAARLFEVSEAGYSVWDPTFIPTQVRLIRSRELGERVVTRLDLLGNPEVAPPRSGFFRFGKPVSKGDLAGAAQRVQSRVTVTPIATTNLIELAYVGRNPKLTADIANALAETYIDWGVEAKFQVIGQASRFLATQIEQLKGDVEQKEAQLRAYGLQKDIVSVDPKTNVTLQKLEMLNHDYASALSDRLTKEARVYELQYAANESIAAETSDPTISQLRADLEKGRRTYAEKLQLFKPEWPAMKQLKLQIDDTQKSLTAAVASAAAKVREAARRDHLTAQRREQSLRAALDSEKQQAMQLNSNAFEFNNLSNEADTKKALLETLQKRLTETELTSRLRGQRVATVRIVDRALVPGSAFVPSYPRALMNGFIAGLSFGILLAFVRDHLDRSLRTVEQVEQFLRLPALGVVPTVGGAQGSRRAPYGYGYAEGSRAKKQGKDAGETETAKIELVPHEHPRSAVAEAYRAVRAALLLSQAGGVRSMVITSYLPGEGKTSTALNLAIVLAQLEKRVLLIDADLHKPRIHEVLRLPNRVGLVSLLVENVVPTSVIQTSPLPGVFVITAGPMSPNPSGLLSSSAMRRFLEFAAMNFDFVVLDSPPVESVADALILGSQTDGIVLCVESGSTPREDVLRLRNRIRQSNVNILGVCINKLREERLGYYKSRPYAKYSTYGDDAKSERRQAASAKRAG